MLRSMGLLVLVCLALVGWMAFKQSDVDTVREVDPASTVQLAVARASYAVAVPSGLPDGYRPTSARTDAGDAVEIRADARGQLGKGICNYSADELRQVMGMKSGEVRAVLPRATEEAVHRDYFVLG